MKTVTQILKGCEHDGSYIPVKEVKRLMQSYHEANLKEEIKIPTIKEACDQCCKEDKIYDEPEEMQSRMLSRADLCKAAYDNGFLNCRSWIERYLKQR